MGVGLVLIECLEQGEGWGGWVVKLLHTNW